jgi:predicted transcriptional regulator
MTELKTNIMDKKELYGLIGFVLSSRNRVKVLKAINEDYKMPSEIGRELDMNFALVSYSLSTLKRKKLVRCLNESASKGRVYVCTPLGLEILNNILKKID